MEDNLGLNRTVLSYLDIGKQPPGEYVLVVDEAAGRSMFWCDDVVADEYVITASRRGFGIVTAFSPLLTWRMIAADRVYMLDTRSILKQDYEEHKITRAYVDELRGPDEPEHKHEEIDYNDLRPGAGYL